MLVGVRMHWVAFFRQPWKVFPSRSPPVYIHRGKCIYLYLKVEMFVLTTAAYDCTEGRGGRFGFLLLVTSGAFWLVYSLLVFFKANR